MASPEVIDVDADAPVRIAGGTGKPDAPLEIASSDSEDESPAKRAKRAPAGPPSPVSVVWPAAVFRPRSPTTRARAARWRHPYPA